MKFSIMCFLVLVVAFFRPPVSRYVTYPDLDGRSEGSAQPVSVGREAQ